jgi:hypothetical protein
MKKSIRNNFKSEEYIVFENGVLRRIFGPKREKVVGSRRKLHSEEFHNIYASQNIVRVVKWSIRLARHLVRMGDMINAYKISVGITWRRIVIRKPEGKGPLGRPRCRWENIRMNLRERELEGVHRIHMA